MKYLDGRTVAAAVIALHGTAHHLLKVWLTLKEMGLSFENNVEITTSSPTPALQRLFSYGDPEGKFFVPFAHTERFKTMKGDASRSIIQTTIQRWRSSGSVVEVDPTNFLSINETPSGALVVSEGRNYPQGLGWGRNGFSLEDETRVAIPLGAFCIWYYRQTGLDETAITAESLAKRLATDLHLSPTEMELIFRSDSPEITLQDSPLTDGEIHTIVEGSSTSWGGEVKVIEQTLQDHLSKVKSMVTTTPGPAWLNTDSVTRFKLAVEGGAKAILLYGPPRTGKTHVIDSVIPRDSEDRITIQIHDGWGYDDLMLGLRPGKDTWEYKVGPLLGAISAGKKFIVLEEINRTDFSQAIGDVFSLLEGAYRGEKHSIQLKNGESFFIPEDVTIICTMNTLDRSTEEVDDALLGRMLSIEFPPRVEDLHLILKESGVSEETGEKVRDLFATILHYYPLGHAYFAEYKEESNPIEYYMTRIRPVLQKHLQNHRDDDIKVIDEKVDSLFGK